MEDEHTDSLVSRMTRIDRQYCKIKIAEMRLLQMKLAYYHECSNDDDNYQLIRRDMTECAYHIENYLSLIRLRVIDRHTRKEFEVGTKEIIDSINDSSIWGIEK